MTPPRRTIYEFGPFRLDVVRRLLACNGTPVPLTPKNLDLLLTLLQRRGQVLTKEELLRRIWPNTMVEESNLTQNIFILRKALGETPNDHSYIVTVPGQGYRFVASVHEFEEPQLPGWVEETTADTNEKRTSITLAVLPFKSIGSRADEQYWGPGLASSLTHRLNRLPLIAARPATATLRFSERGYSPQRAGQELGVSAVLDGTIQREGETIRVNVDFIRVRDGASLWSNQFDNGFTDIFSTQDAISEQVVKALEIELTGEEHRRLVSKETENSEAYRLYIKGRFFWDRRTKHGILKAIEYARRALDLDPNYVRAHIGVADSYLLLGEYLHLSPADSFPLAKAAVLRALELDDSRAEAHASLAEVLFFYEWDWMKAEAEYQRAIELDPNYATANHWYSWFLLTQKRFDEASVEVNIAQRLDPGSLTMATNLGLPFYFRGEYEHAAAYYREVLEMDPDFALAHYYLAIASIQLAHYGEAISSLNKVKGVYQQQVMAQLGYAYASMGRRTEAIRLLHDLQRLKQRDYVSPYVEAVIYVALEDRNQALELLERGYEERAAWLVFLQIEPCFEPLRSEKRFRRLTHKLWG